MDLFNVSDGRKSRPRGQVMLEFFDTLRRAFDQGFDPAVSKVLHKTNDLMPRRRALRKKSEAYALHVATNEKSPCDPVGHCVHRGNSILAPRQQLNNRNATSGNVDANNIGHPGFLRDAQRSISGPLIRT